jgi:hypothetical protein
VAARARTKFLHSLNPAAAAGKHIYLLVDDADHSHPAGLAPYHWSLWRLDVAGGGKVTRVNEPDRILISSFSSDLCVSADSDLSIALTLPRTAQDYGVNGANVRMQVFSASRGGAPVSVSFADIVKWALATWPSVNPSIALPTNAYAYPLAVVGCDESGLLTLRMVIVLPTGSGGGGLWDWLVSIGSNAAFTAPSFTYRGQLDRRTGSTFQAFMPSLPASWAAAGLALPGNTGTFGLGAVDFKGDTSISSECMPLYPNSQTRMVTLTSSSGTSNYAMPDGPKWPNTAVAAYASCGTDPKGCNQQYPTASGAPCGCTAGGTGCCTAGTQLYRPTHAILR